MPNNPEIEHSFLYKLAIYVGGLLVGISAKMAELNNNQKLSLKSFFLHTTVAFACSWVIWGFLDWYGFNDLAVWVSPIIGRFGDSIIFLLFDAVKMSIKSVTNKL